MATIAVTLIISLWLGLSRSNSVERKIYISLNATSPCVRLLNASHQTGCQSSLRGNTGIVHLVANVSDLDWILTQGPNPPYISVLETPTFTREVLMRLKASDRVSGILLLSSDSPPPSLHSPALPCPNQHYGLYRESYGQLYADCNVTVWNPGGNSLSYEDFPFPIFTLRDANQSDIIRKCYNDHNVPVGVSLPPPFPLCGMEISAHMHAVTDTPTCVRRSGGHSSLSLSQDMMCDPLSDNNVWGGFQPVNQSGEGVGERFILIAARLDSRSFFWEVPAGADGSVSGFVASLAIAQALSNLTDITALPLTPLFIFLQGETFDYIGSSRLVYDMKRGEFPLTLDNIHSFIELSQVGLGHSFWMHSDPVSRRNESVDTEVKKLVDSLLNASVGGDVSLLEVSPSQPLPPSSFQRFLREREIPGLVITDHKAEFTNRYYHSNYDNAENIGLNYPEHLTPDQKLNFVTDTAKSIASLATSLARGVYARAGGHDQPTDIQADPVLVSRMLYGFLIQPNNSWFRSILSSEYHKILEKPLNFYVSVQKPVSVTTIVQNILINFTGSVTNLTQPSCIADKQPMGELFFYQWIKGLNESDSRCVQTPVWLSPALSPAFHLRDLSSREYSTWTESRWKEISARIYLVSSKQLEIITLVTGLAILSLSLLVTFVLSRKSDILFSNTPDNSPTLY